MKVLASAGPIQDTPNPRSRMKSWKVALAGLLQRRHSRSLTSWGTPLGPKTPRQVSTDHLVPVASVSVGTPG